MAFSMIVPSSKVKTGKLTVACGGREGYDQRIMISIPHPVWVAALGQAESCNISIGAGEDVGKLLFHPPQGGGADGHFKPTFFKTNILVRLPVMEWAPTFRMPAIDCEHRQSKGGLLVTLPDWAHDKARQTAILKAKEQVARERRAEAAR